MLTVLETLSKGLDVIQYEEITEAILDHHTKYGQRFAWVPKMEFKRPEPGEEERGTMDEVREVTQAEVDEAYKRIRGHLYTIHVDPLSMKALRDAAAEAERDAKLAEIKAEWSAPKL